MGESSKKESSHRTSSKRHHDDGDRDDDNDDDDRRKRRSSSSKKDKKDHKDSKKDRKKSHKHHKRDSEERSVEASESEDELMKQARALIKRAHYFEPGVGPISEEDYFAKSTEFRVWLRDKGKFFDELTSEQAHEQFKKFVKAWNKFKLDKKYYSGIRSSQITAADTTRYKWNFAQNLNRKELETIKDSVDSLTNKEIKDKAVAVTPASSSSTVAPKRRVLGPAMPPPVGGLGEDEDMDDEDRARYARALRKKEQRGYDKSREAALDEVAPRETGREAMLAKRRAQAEFNRRERSPDVELPDSDLMGGDDFRARLAAEKRAQQMREDRRARNRDPAIGDKLAALQSKETETMAMFRRMAEEQKKKGGLGGGGAT
ncbi:hypothetical protein BC936DRAFT_142500 [Jimgerdemannia flammicorona]|uniref:Uncharacterized protein n=1 Tax=Jimgerdemannia flammicorona TaxID=994334 RepID=A0A433DF02_9FUNG|nr:hypothetical protein BC936DRAFT_142500 [Jimgerdemannia flammicorona]